MPESDRKFFYDKVVDELKERDKEAKKAESAARSAKGRRR